jgi:hypothetical protein
MRSSRWSPFLQKSECGRHYPTSIGTIQQRIGCGKIVMPPKTLTKHEDQLCSTGALKCCLKRTLRSLWASAVPCHQGCRATASFSVLELLKGRRRVIAWPRATNAAERRILDMFKHLHCVVPFPKAATLRRRVLWRYAAHIDLTQFFQQSVLEAKHRFYFAHKGKVDALTTIPTGAVSPPIMAQILLRACVTLAIRRANVTDRVVFDTMIDNARLCSNDWDALSAAWTELLRGFRLLGCDGRRAPPAVKVDGVL